ncbi:MAG: transposase, partial [Candidatus Tisiphia sp.]
MNFILNYFYNLHKLSDTLISKVTDGILEEVTAWQNRGLDSVYPIMYLDCIHVKARDNHVIINKAVYLAIG